jgi:hypothetical protein
MEKDFWVCWLLGVLFSDPDLAPHLVFKGGTSLSKAYGAIDRFSEDVDLSLSPAFVGVDVPAFEALRSRGKIEAAVKKMQRLCDVKVKQHLAPAIEAAMRAVVGDHPGGQGWVDHEYDEQADSSNLYLRYPATQTTGFPYIVRSVKLEVGSLTDQQPVGTHAVMPWIAEEFPDLFSDFRCDVTAMDIARSFWEKATILHGEYYRAHDSSVPTRYARHYSDVARLCLNPDAPTFLADKALCARVADWKKRVFARAWARYDLAQHGTFRLVPPEERYPELAADYAEMHPMFLKEPPSFEEVIKVLRVAEEAINSA